MTTATDMSGRSVAYTLIEPLVNDPIESHYPPACRLPPRGGWTVTVMEVGRSAAQRLKNWRRCYVDVGYIAVKA